jgi:CDP-diacylglycerol---glycerol-3-phosphate 3-phosphatidyltransferase
MANALTAIRLCLVLPFAWLMAASDGARAPWAAAILAVGIATDLLDGVVARRRGTASAGGRLFDHTADVLLVVAGLAGGAMRGVFPWILPVLVGLAFTQYALDSYWLDRAGQLRASRLGRYNGILYFVPLAGDILVRLGGEPLRPVVTAIAWLLVASTLVSMAERMIAAIRVRGRRAGATLAGGTGDRPPR